MASKASFPASLLRTYTSLLSQRTSQLQFQASRLLGVEFRSQSQNAWRQHIEGVTRGIERMTGTNARPQPIPIPIRTQTIFGQRRFHSTDFQPKPTKAYSFDDVRPLPLSALLTQLTAPPLDPQPHPIPHLLHPPHRRTRTPRIRRKLNPNSHKYPNHIPARRAAPRRRRFPGALWVRETAAEEGGGVLL